MKNGIKGTARPAILSQVSEREKTASVRESLPRFFIVVQSHTIIPTQEIASNPAIRWANSPFLGAISIPNVSIMSPPSIRPLAITAVVIAQTVRRISNKTVAGFMPPTFPQSTPCQFHNASCFSFALSCSAFRCSVSICS
jgi:hypothetical protein